MAILTPRTIQLTSGTACTIRSAQPGDAEALIANARVNLEEPFIITRPDEFTYTVEQERTWITDHAERPGWLAIVAEADDAVVGLLSFENGAKRRIAHRGILGMSVMPAWRRRGVGSALLDALLDWGSQSDLIRKICLAVVEGNEPAMGLYRKHGFREEGRRPNEIRYEDGTYAADRVMYRLV